MTQTEMTVDEQLDLLNRGAVDLISEADLRAKLHSGRQLRVKLGLDPTRPDLHLGHAVVLRKLRQFQDLGHKVVLIVGDFTAMIGDPSGKNKTRPPLSLQQTRENAQSYVDQARLILRQDPEVFELRYNSEWLEPMGFEDVIRLASRYTVARMLERNDFTNRLDAGTPISLHELLYPLAQAQDSVAIRADVELGGTDQLFNLLVGRDIQREDGQEPQVVLTTPLLVGLDGVEKMSKSLDNYIALTDKAEDMYAKLMKVPDAQMSDYFILITDFNTDDIKIILDAHPTVAHRVLASVITAWLHGANIDKKIDQSLLKSISREDYNNLFGRKYGFSRPDDIISIFTQVRQYNEKEARLLDLAIGIAEVVNLHNEEIDKLRKYLSNNNEIVNISNIIIEQTAKGDDFPVTEAQLSHLNSLINDRDTKYAEEALNDIISVAAKQVNTKPEQAGIANELVRIALSRARFESVAKGGIPDDLPIYVLSPAELNPAGRIALARLASLSGLEASVSAARKLIGNRGLKVDGEAATDPLATVTPTSGLVLQKGKDKFVKIQLAES